MSDFQVSSSGSASSGVDSNATVTTMAPIRSPLRQRLNLNTPSISASSSNKRSKQTLPVDYPTSILIPTRGVVKSLYEEAESQGSLEQRQVDAGLLSLPFVLLPAVAYQEEQALKEVQAKVQRDHPELTSAMTYCRKAIYDSIGAAMVAANKSHADREKVWAEKRRNDQAKKAEEQARREEEDMKLEEINRNKRKRELVKKHTPNVELWRERLLLMTELRDLEKEERLWKEAIKDLEEREAEIKSEEEAVKADMKVEVAEVQPIEEVAGLEEAVQAVTISSIRIQQALKIVSETIASSDKTRKDLYHRYRQDHQFHGYQGVKDPKGLLRALSQSQDPSE